MTNNNQILGLDEVLAAYVHESQEFDEKVLKAFVDKYPEYALALHRYAQVQLTSVRASVEEVESEDISDAELLPLQSKLLLRMQKLRGEPSASDIAQASKKLSSISGERATQAATLSVFRSCEHGEDLLLLSITDSVSEVKGVPAWFYEGLGSHLMLPAAVIQASIASRGQFAGNQRFSTKRKPIEPPPLTWEQAVEDSISDEEIRAAILERTDHS